LGNDCNKACVQVWNGTKKHAVLNLPTTTLSSKQQNPHHPQHAFYANNVRL